jgi:hypothetical protein
MTSGNIHIGILIRPFMSGKTLAMTRRFRQLKW